MYLFITTVLAYLRRTIERIERWKTRFRSLPRISTTIFPIDFSKRHVSIEEKKIWFFSTCLLQKNLEHFQRFLSFFLSFLIQRRWRVTVFFFQLIFSKSWPIKNLLALNTNEISLTGAKLFPVPASWNSSPSRKRLRARRRREEKERKRGGEKKDRKVIEARS